MKNIWEFWIAMYPWLKIYAPIVLVLLGVLPLLQRLIRQIVTIWEQRRLQRDLSPLYTAAEIQRAIQYYVETNAQNVAPSQDEEPGRTHAFAAKEPMIPFFLNKAFRHQTDRPSFYMVLADSGMGKTTFLINLYRRYRRQFFRPQYQIRLLPLDAPQVDQEIEQIPDAEKRNTILLLDAFDKDFRAVRDYNARLNDLIHKTASFREVIITCRTQFSPREEEETGVLPFSSDGGELLLRKFYLSPFDDRDIRDYLRQHFSWLQWAKRANAQKIVASCPHLMARPLLLSYIDDLLHDQTSYTSAYMLYAALIAKWIEREARHVEPERRGHYQEELWRFSREIAIEMYRRRTEHRGSLLIPGSDIILLAEKYHITLNTMEMTSRSLLNRTAHGEYKFAHKSVLEYFLAEEAFLNPEFRRELSFDGLDQARAFFGEMLRAKGTPVERETTPFIRIDSPYRSGNLIQELEQGRTAMFYGRTETIQRLRHILIHDDDSLVILYGQRRTGKSCFIKYLEQTRRFEPDLRIVSIDIQGLSSEQDVYDAVLRGVHAFVRPGQEYRARSISFAEFHAALRQLLDAADRRMLIMFDEFEHVTGEHFKYTSLADAAEFIGKIRHLLQHTPQVKFALAGADGLRAMLDDYDNPLFQAGRTLQIGFLKPQEARALITHPLSGVVNFTEPAIAAIQEATYNHPCFLQCLCQNIVDVLNAKERYTAAANEVAQAIAAFHQHESGKLDYVWEKTGPAEHLVLAIIAQEMRAGATWVAIERIEAVMADQGLPAPGDIRDGPLKYLLHKDFVLEHDTELAYRIPMGLLQTWLTHYKPLTRIRREITP